MFVLVEPFKCFHIDDKPDLGCASLIASLNQNNIKNKLILGQTRFLHDFLKRPQEMLDLFFEMPNNALEKIKFRYIYNQIKEDGEKEFKATLKKYHNQIIKNNLSLFLNPSNLTKISNLLKFYLEISEYQLLKEKNETIPLIEETFKLIKSKKPDSVGFSLWNSDPFTNTIRKKIKKELQIPIIIGGALTSHLRNDKIKRFIQENNIDYLIAGEGENTLPNLIQKMEQTNPGFIRTKPILNLDKLPIPNFDQFKLKEYFSPIIDLPIQMSRGCAWGKCAFCNHHKLYNNIFRAIKKEKIIDMLKKLSEKYNTKYFSFNDEHVPAIILRKLSQGLIKEGMNNLKFRAYVRFEKEFLRKRTLNLMYKAGFRNLSWGLESGSQIILNLMNKGIDLKEAKKILKTSSKVGIKNNCWIIVGFPRENIENFKETIRFLEKNRKNIHCIFPSKFLLLDNTSISSEPEKYKINIIKKDSLTDILKFNYLNPSNHIKKIDDSLFLINSGICNLTSNFYRCMPQNNIKHNIMFSLSTLKRINRRQAIKSLNSSKDNNIYPLILGEMTDKFWHVIKKKESLYINSKMHLKIKINRIEKDIAELSQKNLSIKVIIHKISQKNKLNFKKCQKILKKFYEKLTKYDAIIFYTKE